MGDSSEKGISKCTLSFMFVFAIIATAAAITLSIFLGVQGYIGFDGGTPIVASCTSDNYSISKFSSTNLTVFLEIVFVTTITSASLCLLVTLILLFFLCRACGSSQELPPQPSAGSLGFLYILISLLCLAAAITFGYFFVYALELNNCTVTCNKTQIFVYLIISGVVLALAIILWFCLTFIHCYCRPGNNETQQKYRQVAHKTQVNEPQESRVRRRVEPVQPVEHTKQSIFQSPQKRQTAYLYKKQSPKPAPYQEHLIRQRREELVYARSRSPEPVALREPEYILSRPKVYRQDDESLQREEKKYLSRYGGGGSILPSSGVEQKDSPPNSRVYRYGQDYFRQGEPARKYQESSPARRSPQQGLAREGMLINYIRGKYAN